MEQKWEKWRGTESPQQVSLSNGVTKAAWDPAPLSRFHTAFQLPRGPQVKLFLVLCDSFCPCMRY